MLVFCKGDAITGGCTGEDPQKWLEFFRKLITMKDVKAKGEWEMNELLWLVI